MLANSEFTVCEEATKSLESIHLHLRPILRDTIFGGQYAAEISSKHCHGTDNDRALGICVSHSLPTREYNAC